jgi:menaquinone-dependent protoporphyrinogen oxidase
MTSMSRVLVAYEALAAPGPQALGAREHLVFGGRLPLEPSNFMERAMVRNTPEEQRLRDLDEIRGWAAKIAADL